MLAAAHELEVPLYTSSPGDSSIGMNVAEQALAGSKLRFDVSADVNETASIVLEAKRSRRQERGADRRRREPQELHAADRAADSGGPGHRRAGPRLLPADDRRASRHRRTLRRDAGRGGELGQDRSGPAARHRRGVQRQLDRAPAADGLRHGEALGPAAQAAVRPSTRR